MAGKYISENTFLPETKYVQNIDNSCLWRVNKNAQNHRNNTLNRLQRRMS